MTLPPKVQTLVDELRRVLGLHPFDIDGFDINMDREGIVQDVKPKMAFRRGKPVAAAPVGGPECCGVMMRWDRTMEHYQCDWCKKTVDLHGLVRA